MSQEGENEYYEYFSSPLHYAVRYSCSNEMIENMICSGIDVNTTNYYGETPLHYAIFRNDPRIVKLLLEKGANPYMSYTDGDTAIGMARKYEDLWPIMRPYSKAIRRWKLIRSYFIAKSALLDLYTDTLERIWCPGGPGYQVTKIQFELCLNLLQTK